MEVTFATSCWKRDWKLILKGENYLKEKQIENHLFPFSKRMVVINNVDDVEEVLFFAREKIEKNVLTDVYVASDSAGDVLSFFNLKREDFGNEWVYYNAIGVLTAIYFCKTPYFLYMNGDVFLNERIDWIPKAIERMEKKEEYKVANLTWNYNSAESKKESCKKDKDFFVAKRGFSDQLFLVRRDDFRAPIYGEIREDASHFPRGDVFEKRVYSFMINHKWKRITYRKGSYIHASFY